MTDTTIIDCRLQRLALASPPLLTCFLLCSRVPAFRDCCWKRLRLTGCQDICWPWLLTVPCKGEKEEPLHGQGSSASSERKGEKKSLPLSSIEMLLNHKQFSQPQLGCVHLKNLKMLGRRMGKVSAGPQQCRYPPPDQGTQKPHCLPHQVSMGWHK